MQKVIKAKTKASFYSRSIFWKLNQRIAHNKRAIKNTKSSTLVVPLKNLGAKFSKKLKAFLYQTISVEAFNKAWKEKKKD